jgi:Ca2+/Na+ antiporter
LFPVEIGLIGVMTETNWMKLGTMLGGILFLAALIPVSVALFSGREDFG